MIAVSEGTQRAPDPYRCCYGYTHVVVDLSDHPAITGEWHGEPLSDALCIAAGLSPGCVSTAAGRYQINKPTWVHLKTKLGLRSFDGPSQDDAAIEDIKEAGALELVNAGRVADAISKCRGIWASLPGNTAGQPQRSYAELVNAYANAGGAFA